MKKLVYKYLHSLTLIIVINHYAVCQDIQYVVSSESYNVGLSTSGPVIQLGRLSKSGYYGEVLIEIHAYTFENDESLINKPAPGGVYAAFDFFTNMGTSKPFKFHFGIGYGVYKEESGKNSGYDLTGQIIVVDLHIGGRYYFTERLFAGLILGLPLNTDRSKSILTQINYHKEEVLIPGLLMIGFRL